MRHKAARLSLGLTLVAALMSIQTPSAGADHVVSNPDPSKIDYTPIGYYGPADEAGTSAGESATVPTPGEYPLAPPFIDTPNPSGKWVAYDTNVWESLSLPSRHPGDNCNTLSPEKQAELNCQAGDLDPDGDGPSGYSGPGGTSNQHGFCPPSSNPEFTPWGECDNNQLEWLDHYERSMKEMLGDFGVVVHRYPFEAPAGSRGLYLDAAGGQGINISATVPGEDHPDETVLVSGHFDFTDSGPAAAWDSAEGHTEVMRMAYIMSDYWRKTGTRPSATVKFIPWDAEEGGTVGSADYARNNIVPGEESKVRAYFNVDPCAGAYPAYKNGAFPVRVPEVMQLANPRNFMVRDANGNLVDTPRSLRIRAFNAKAELVVDQVFDYLDDTITVAPGVEQPIFVSNAEAAVGHDGKNPVLVSQRREIVTAVGGLALFSSDYRNFEPLGIPIFNLFPDYFGPHADGIPGHNDGIAILHTPNDNLTTINRLTSADATGVSASEGWAKGMEMCAQIEAWYMLQPEMGGARPATTDVVAYYEALPNEAIQNEPVEFDASGSYQYSDASSRTLVDESNLTFTWDFGDGTTGSGKIAQHTYSRIGRYVTRLTVTGASGSTDTMTIPVVVVPSPFKSPRLSPIDAEDAADGSFSLSWDFTATREDFSHFRVDESTNVVGLFGDDAQDGIDPARWGTSKEPPTSNIEPWQPSDSATVKFRGNQFRSPDRSFWTGVTPALFNPPPTNATSTLTTKQPIPIPADGDPELSYWSLFQNEGDDQGRVEVALVDDAGNVGEWQPVDIIQATLTALGDPHDPAVCSTATTQETLEQGFENRRVSLAGFKGKNLLVRFVYRLGPDNRALSNPCGWYIDDIRMYTGTFSQIGTTTAETFDVAGRRNGEYWYRVTGLYRDGVATLPSNVESTRVTQAKPDLVVTNIEATNNKGVREGQKVTVTATVKNDGNEDAAASKTELLLDGATVLGVVDTTPLAPGASTTVSVQWDTRNTKGEHTIKVTADKAATVAETNEANNDLTAVFVVHGNKVKNSSFETANESGTGPSNWSESDSGAGTTSWSGVGSDGIRSASVSGNGGSATLAGSPTWTSDAVSVTAGESLTLALSVQSSDASSAATAGLAYLGPAGEVLDTVTLVTAPLTTVAFQTLEETVTIPLGVAEVRVVLKGFAPTDTSTSGTVTFDEVGLFGNP